VRNLRRPPQEAPQEVDGYTEAVDDKPVWPYGLAFNVLLGVGAVTLTARRLRTPARRIPKGVRIA
jgi:hypothetical protein